MNLNDAMVKALADLLAPAVRQALAPPPPTEEETKRQARLLASRKAIFGGEEPPTEHGLLIDGKQAARLLGVCEKTLQRMSRNGEMPPLIKIGRAVRWSYPAIKAWVEAGCPPVKKGKGTVSEIHLKRDRKPPVHAAGQRLKLLIKNDLRQCLGIQAGFPPPPIQRPDLSGQSPTRVGPLTFQGSHPGRSLPVRCPPP